MEIITQRREELAKELNSVVQDLNKAEQSVSLQRQKAFSLQEKINVLDELISLEVQETDVLEDGDQLEPEA